MDTSHLFSTPHPRLAPPSMAQQQGFQPGLSQVQYSAVRDTRQDVSSHPPVGHYAELIQRRTEVLQVGVQCPAVKELLLSVHFNRKWQFTQCFEYIFV